MSCDTVLPWNVTEEKQAEGLAVAWAAISGACEECKDSFRCCTNVQFRPGEDAPCTKRKKEILKEGNFKNCREITKPSH